MRAAGAPASATLEPCFLVHLDIQAEGVACVQDALAAFTQPETIHGDARGFFRVFGFNGLGLF